MQGWPEQYISLLRQPEQGSTTGTTGSISRTPVIATGTRSTGSYSTTISGSTRKNRTMLGVEKEILEVKMAIISESSKLWTNFKQNQTNKGVVLENIEE